jgi:7,8-dihydropterin-6-yl-methyl-4-(beta-D-ribofuranosyl)aminobenzene 5'-phosphate synthase
MTTLEDVGTLTAAAVTVLVDNRADVIVRSTETVRYFTDQPLLAEHGLAALIDLPDAGMRILWDAGGSRVALMENARRMDVDWTTVDAVALSHGHWDHTAAMSDALLAMDRRPAAREWPAGTTSAEVEAWVQEKRVPMVMHPAVLRERWRVNKDGKRFGPSAPPPTDIWEALGAEIVTSEDPYQFAPGCWTTGYVPRESFEHSGRSKQSYYRDGDRLIRDDVEDDQALVLNLEDKGLVVVAGCAHAGIVNTVRHAQAITGVDRVHAVLGGFHLAHAEADELEETIAAFKQWQPALISASHCTGFGPICRFAAEFPDTFVPGVVGVTYRF